jgi:hypothetical protein
MNQSGRTNGGLPRILRTHARPVRLTNAAAANCAEELVLDEFSEDCGGFKLRMLHAFDELPHGARGAIENPFTDLAWFRHLEAATQIAGEELRLYCATEGARHFVLPMMATSGGLAGTGMRCATGLANFYSPCFGPITNGDADFQRRCIEGIVGALSEERPAWDALLFQPLDPESPFYDALLPALRRAGYLSDDYFAFGNWYLPARGLAFDNYFAELPSVIRHTVERARRKLHNEGWRIEIFQRPGRDLDAAIAAFAAVYRNSWKKPEPYQRFIPGLCRVAAKAGWLRLGLLYVGDRPAAAQIWLNTPAKAFIYKLAYDERYARLSVGSVLSAAMFRHALDVDRVDEIDYLAGDDPYKRDWMSRRRERRGIVAFDRRRPRAVLAAARHFSGSWFNRLRDFAPGSKVYALHERRLARGSRDGSGATDRTLSRRLEA